jgi:hypothetical protein
MECWKVGIVESGRDTSNLGVLVVSVGAGFIPAQKVFRLAGRHEALIE